MPNPGWLDDLYPDPPNRLAAPSGANTTLGADQTSLPSQLGRLASYALSGQSSNPFSVSGVIKNTTGFETSSLPGYLSKPIEYLGSPLGLAATVAAPLTGGASLAELGAAGVATRIGAAAATGVAGGLVGEEAGTLAAKGANALGAPDWLQTGVGIAAGLGAGALTGHITGKALARAIPGMGEALIPPEDLSRTSEGLSRKINQATKESATAHYLAEQASTAEEAAGHLQAAKIADQIAQEATLAKANIDGPVRITDPAYGLDPIDRGINLIKGALNIGDKADARVQPIVDNMYQGRRQVNSLANEARSRILDTITSRDDIKYGEFGKGKATLINVAGEWLPFQDIADAPSSFPLTADQRLFMRSIESELESYRQQFFTNGGKLGHRASIDRTQGGMDIPRGRGLEDTTSALFSYTNDKPLGLAPSVREEINYPTMGDGLAAGIEYPRLEDAVSEYIGGIGKGIVERNALTRLTRITDADGNRVFIHPEELVDPALAALKDQNTASLNVQTSNLNDVLAAGRSRTAQITQLQDLLTKVDERSAAASLEASFTGEAAIKAASPELDDIKAQLAQLQSEQALHANTLNDELSNLNSAKTAADVSDKAYNQALREATYNPNYDSIKRAPEGLADLIGPRDLTNAINSVFKPDNTLQKLNYVNDTLRAFHTVMDLAFSGRLAPTTLLTHPFDYFKALQTGYSSAFTPAALGKDIAALNEGFKKAGVLNPRGTPMTVADMVRHGLVLGDTDMSVPKLFAGIPGIKGASNIYQNAVSSMRLNMMSTEILNAAGRGAPLTMDTIQSIAKGINLTTGASIHKPAPGASLFIQFPNWLQSQMEFLTHGASGIPSLMGIGSAPLESRYAAQALVKMVGVGLATTYTVNAMGGHETTYTNGVPVMRIGDQKINVFGPYGSLVGGMYAALKPEGDVSTLVRSRVSPMFQIGWDLASGSTFMGQPAKVNDPQYWMQAMAPYGAASIAEGKTPNISTTLQALGIRASEVSNYQHLLDAAHDVYNKDYADLTGKERQDLQFLHPDLMQALQEQTLQKAAVGDPKAQAAIKTQAVNDDVVQKQASLNSLLQKGTMSPEQFRIALRELSKESTAQKRQIRTDYGMDSIDKTPSHIQDALNQYFDLFNQADNGILQGSKTPVGQTNWDVFDKLEQELMSKLDPLQQKAITDRVAVHDPSLNWFYQNKDIINSSPYFQATDTVFDRMGKPGGFDSYTALREAQNKAQVDGNRGQYIRTTALINRIDSLVTPLHNQMTRTNPQLYKALVENGYVQQAKGRQMAATIN